MCLTFGNDSRPFVMLVHARVACMRLWGAGRVRCVQPSAWLCAGSRGCVRLVRTDRHWSRGQPKTMRTGCWQQAFVAKKQKGSGPGKWCTRAPPMPVNAPDSVPTVLRAQASKSGDSKCVGKLVTSSL